MITFIDVSELKLSQGEISVTDKSYISTYDSIKKLSYDRRIIFGEKSSGN